MTYVFGAGSVLAQHSDPISTASMVAQDLITSSGVLDNTTTLVESSVTTGVLIDGNTSLTTTTVLQVKPSEELLLPGVGLLKISDTWAKRFEAVGIHPGTLYTLKAPDLTAEEETLRLARQHYFQGCYHLELGENGRALEQFSKAAELDPGNAHILLELARAKMAVREPEEARNFALQALDLETTSVQAMLVIAEAYLLSGDATKGGERDQLVKNAVEALEKARSFEPKNLTVLGALAKAYVQQQNVDKIIATYREIVQVNPRDTYSLLILAQVLSRLNKNQEAVQYYEKVIEQRPGFIGGYVYLGQLLEQLNRNSAALDLYKKALLVEPGNVELLRRFEDLLRKQYGEKNRKAIIAQYEAFAKAYPLNSAVQKIFAERLEGEELLDRAAEQYRTILKNDTENLEVMQALAAIYLRLEKYDDAIEVLNRALEVSPDKLDLYDMVAATFLKQQDRSKAIEVYQRAVSKNPKADKLYISLAALLDQDNQTTRAVAVLEDALKEAGEKAEVLAVLGKFYKDDKQTTVARDYLERAQKLVPENPQLFAELLRVVLNSGDTTGATKLVTEGVEKTASAKDVFYGLAGEVYKESGDSTTGLELMTKALELNPDKVDYIGRIVAMHVSNKDFTKALAVLDQNAAKVGNADKVEQLRAEIHIAARQFNEAIGIYRVLLRENPLDLESYQLLVDAYIAASRFEDSLGVVREAEQKFGDTKKEELLAMRGLVLYRDKKYDEAEKVFRQLLLTELTKKDDVHYYLGSIYLDREQYAQAEKEFRKAIDANPLNANALNALGYMFADRNIRLDEAERLVRDALGLAPLAPHILDSMGWVLYRKGELDEAQGYIEKAAEMYEDAEIFDHLGEIYQKQGKLDRAKQMFERAFELDPKRSGLKIKLDKLR